MQLFNGQAESTRCQRMVHRKSRRKEKRSSYMTGCRNKRAKTNATAARVGKQDYVGGSPSPSHTAAPTLPSSFIPVSQSPCFLRPWWWPMPTPMPSSRNQSLHDCAPSMPPKRKCKECKPKRREYSLFVTSDTEAEGQTLDAKAAWDLSQANYKFFGKREWEAKAMVNRYLRTQFHGKPIVDALAALEEEVSSSPLEPKIIEKKQRRRREASRLSRFGREHMRQQDEIRRTHLLETLPLIPLVGPPHSELY